MLSVRQHVTLYSVLDNENTIRLVVLACLFVFVRLLVFVDLCVVCLLVCLCVCLFVCEAKWRLLVCLLVCLLVVWL